MIESNSDVNLLNQMYTDILNLRYDQFLNVMGDDYSNNELYYDSKSRAFSNKDQFSEHSFLFFVVRYEEFYDEDSFYEYITESFEKVSKRFILMEPSDFFINRLPLSLIPNPESFIIKHIYELLEMPRVKTKKFIKDRMNRDIALAILNSNMNIDQIESNLIIYLDYIMDDQNRAELIEDITDQKVINLIEFAANFEKGQN